MMIGIFKKKNSKVVDNSDQIVNDFTLRGPYWDYRTIPYQIYKPFITYQQEIDTFLDELIKQSAVDDGNGDVMTNLIDDATKTALANLEKQRINHEDVIKSFDIRLKTDQEHTSMELELMEKELNRVDEELEEITARCEKEKFIDKGGQDYE